MPRVETCGFAFIAAEPRSKLVTRAIVAHSSDGDVGVQFGDHLGSEVTIYLPPEAWAAIGAAAAELARHTTGYGRCPSCEVRREYERDRPQQDVSSQ